MHGTRKNGKALRCSLCGAMAPKDPDKPTKHKKDCPVLQYQNENNRAATETTLQHLKHSFVRRSFDRWANGNQYGAFNSDED